MRSILASLLLVSLCGCAHARIEDTITLRGSELCWEDDRGDEVCLTARPAQDASSLLPCLSYGGILLCGAAGTMTLKAPLYQTGGER